MLGEFRRNRSTNDQVFFVRQVLGRGLEGAQSGCVSATISLKQTCDSVTSKAVHNILIKFGLKIKILGLIKTSLNETYYKVCVGKHLFDAFTTENGLKEGNAL